MIGKAAPQPPGGTQQSTDDHTQLIASLVGGAAFVAEFVMLAALVHAPALAGHSVRRIHPADWRQPLHQQIVRMARAELLLYGRVDRRGLTLRLLETGINSYELDLLVRTLERVAQLLDEAIVGNAAVALMARRRGAAA